MKKHCTKCAQHPELMHTGQGPNKPQWYCVVCKSEYYQNERGEIVKDRPFSWPVGVKANKEKAVLKNGHWYWQNVT